MISEGSVKYWLTYFTNKSPATLLKRSNSLSRLVNDLHAHNQEFPCSESELYDHLCRQRSEGAPSSRLKALLEAVTFVRHVFGCESLDFAVKSRRCMGAASSKTVETVKQAPPLTVEHLKCIHAVLETDPDPWNVVFCGMVLFCVYGRARWSDAATFTVCGMGLRFRWQHLLCGVFNSCP